MIKKSQNISTDFVFKNSKFLQGLENQPKKFNNTDRTNWNPKYCGEIDMRISRDGTWYYCNSPIGRKALVKLFSSILIKEAERYFLITPVEKVGIIVDDVPFIAIDFNIITKNGNSSILFQTNVDHEILLGAHNPMRVHFNKKTQEPSPYILVRENIEARIDRKSFYRLIELGEYFKKNGEDWFGIRSDNIFFPIITKSELER